MTALTAELARRRSAESVSADRPAATEPAPVPGPQHSPLGPGRAKTATVMHGENMSPRPYCPRCVRAVSDHDVRHRPLRSLATLAVSCPFGGQPEASQLSAPAGTRACGEQSSRRSWLGDLRQVAAVRPLGLAEQAGAPLRTERVVPLVLRADLDRVSCLEVVQQLDGVLRGQVLVEVVVDLRGRARRTRVGVVRGASRLVSDGRAPCPARRAASRPGAAARTRERAPAPWAR